MGPQLLLGGHPARARYEEQVQALAQQRVRDTDGHARGAVGVIGVRGLHLQWGDLRAAAHDELLGAPDEFHPAVRPPVPGEVAGAQPAAGHGGGGGGGVVEVAGHQMGRTEPEFTGRTGFGVGTGGARGAVHGHDAVLHAGGGAPDGARLLVVAVGGEDEVGGGALAQPEDVGDPGVRQQGPHPAAEAARQGFAAADPGTRGARRGEPRRQGGSVRGVELAADQAQHAGDDGGPVDGPPREELQHPAGPEARGEQQGAAGREGEQRGPLPEAEVEVQQVQGGLALAERQRPGDRLELGVQGAVGEHHALGAAGGAGGEDHQGLLGVQFGRRERRAAGGAVLDDLADPGVAGRAGGVLPGRGAVAGVAEQEPGADAFGGGAQHQRGGVPVHRDHDRPGGPGGEFAHEVPAPVVHRDENGFPAPQAGRGQGGGEGAAPLAEFAVAEDVLPVVEGDAVREARAGQFEERVEPLGGARQGSGGGAGRGAGQGGGGGHAGTFRTAGRRSPGISSPRSPSPAG